MAAALNFLNNPQDFTDRAPSLPRKRTFSATDASSGEEDGRHHERDSDSEMSDESHARQRAPKRRLTEQVAERLRALNLEATGRPRFEVPPAPRDSSPREAPNRFDFLGPLRSGASNTSSSPDAPIAAPESKKRLRDSEGESDSHDTDADLNELLRPMKRLRLVDESHVPAIPDPPVASPRVPPKWPTSPKITISEPREDDAIDGAVNTRDLVPVRSITLHPRAVSALLKQSSLWKLVSPDQHIDNSRALIPYAPGKPPALHEALLRYMLRARREDEPESELPEPTVKVESMSSDDESGEDDNAMSLSSSKELSDDAEATNSDMDVDLVF